MQRPGLSGGSLGDEDMAAKATYLNGMLGLGLGPAGTLPAAGGSGQVQPSTQLPVLVDQRQQQAPWPQMGAANGGQGPEASWLQSGGGATDGSGGAPAVSGRLEPHTMDAKLAAAREKNRLAQQRFRERQRAKQQQAGQECEVLQQEMDELESENERLSRQNHIYEKVLAVRDAMLQTFTSLQPPATQQQQQQQGQPQVPAPASAAAQGLARALDELPSELEMENAAPTDMDASATATTTAAAAAQPQQLLPVKVEQQQQGPPPPPPPPQRPGCLEASASSASCTLASAEGCSAHPVTPPGQQQGQPQWMLGEPHRTGTAVQLDGSALQQVGNIPPATNQAVRAMVAAMTDPEQLLDYYRQWQAELGVSYLAAEAAGFDEASVREVDALTDRMTEMWFHVGQLKPAYVCFLAHAALPENSSQLPLWREIAEKLLPQMDAESRSIVRRSWHNYSMRLAKAAMGVSKWVKRLQQYAVHPAASLATNAACALELGEITTHVAAAVQEEYLASMEFVAAQGPASSTLLKAYVNYASAPYLPDIVAIVYHILCMDSEEKQAKQDQAQNGQSAQASLPPAGDAAMPPAGGAPAAGAAAPAQE